MYIHFSLKRSYRLFGGSIETMASFNENIDKLFQDNPYSKEISDLENLMKEKNSQIEDNITFYKDIRSAIKNKLNKQSEASTLLNSFQNQNEQMQKNEKKRETIEMKMKENAEEKEKHKKDISEISGFMKKQEEIIQLHQSKWENLKVVRDSKNKELEKIKNEEILWKQKREKWSQKNTETYAEHMSKNEALKTSIRSMSYELGCVNNQNTIDQSITYLKSYISQNFEDQKLEEETVRKRQGDLHKNLNELREKLMDLWSKSSLSLDSDTLNTARSEAPLPPPNEPSQTEVESLSASEQISQFSEADCNDRPPTPQSPPLPRSYDDFDENCQKTSSPEQNHNISSSSFESDIPDSHASEKNSQEIRKSKDGETDVNEMISSSELFNPEKDDANNQNQPLASQKQGDNQCPVENLVPSDAQVTQPPNGMNNITQSNPPLTPTNADANVVADAPAMTTDSEIQDGGETATTVSEVGSKLNAEQGSTISTEHTSVGTSACNSASTSTSLVSTQLFKPSTTECDLQSQMNDDDEFNLVSERFEASSNKEKGPSSVSIYRPVVEAISPFKSSSEGEGGNKVANHVVDDGIDYVKKGKGKVGKRPLDESSSAVSRLIKAQKMVSQTTSSKTNKPQQPREPVRIQRKSQLHDFNMEGEYSNILLKNCCILCAKLCNKRSNSNLRFHFLTMCPKMKPFLQELGCGEWACVLCSHHSDNLFELSQHVLSTHKNELTFCSVCNQLVFLADLKLHMRDHLLEIDASPLECNKCDNVYPNATEFFLHLLNIHGFLKNQVTKVVAKRHLKYDNVLSVLAVTCKKSNTM